MAGEALPLPAVQSIFYQALRAIECVHGHGVLHRRVKLDDLPHMAVASS